MRGADRSLHAETLAVADVPQALRRRLYDLFVDGYDGVSAAKFMEDFDAKSHVIVLRDRCGDIRGFSTLTEYGRRYGDRDVRLVFNGDSVIDRDHWGSTALFRAWLRYLLKRQTENMPVPTFWLLTTKGHRVFRMLPLFFRRYWPSWSEEACDGDLKPLADRIGLSEFPGRYDPASGIIALAPHGERLTKDLADIPDKDTEREDVRFFLERNPNYRSGEELLCLARVLPENLSAYAGRYLQCREHKT